MGTSVTGDWPSVLSYQHKSLDEKFEVAIANGESERIWKEVVD
jgi:hypothetical protein